MSDTASGHEGASVSFHDRRRNMDPLVYIRGQGIVKAVNFTCGTSSEEGMIYLNYLMNGKTVAELFYAEFDRIAENMPYLAMKKILLYIKTYRLASQPPPRNNSLMNCSPIHSIHLIRTRAIIFCFQTSKSHSLSGILIE